MPLDWIDIGSLEDVPTLGARVVKTARGPVAVFKTSDGHVHALLDKCPHKGGPLSQGIVHDCRVTCPLHGWVISLETGEATGADTGRTPRIPVSVAVGRLLISASALDALPN